MNTPLARASMARPVPRGVPAGEPAPGAGLRLDLMNQLGLRLDSIMSDDGDSFVTVRCHDEAGRRVVLKYVHSDSADAYRRLRNETLLVRHLPAHAPLRLLPYRADGPGYLVTDFDSGVLLRPDSFDLGVVPTIADALTQFQAIRLNLRQLGVVDRERLATYYVKVMLKHLLHLWPAQISAREAARCLAILMASLPAMLRHQVICHGDFLPTNLLYHADDESVTFTDLEGFMSGNHPLFDVIALLSTGGLDLQDWAWQRAFLGRYLGADADGPGLDPRSREYQDAYRGILVFFLVYRLNEQLNALNGGTYFDGLGKRRFLMRKAAQLATGRAHAWRDEAMEAALDVRQRNLRLALSTKLFREHLEAVHSPLAKRN